MTTTPTFPYTAPLTIPVLSLPYTDPASQAAYPNAVFQPGQTVIDGRAFQLGITAYLFESLAAFEAGATPINGFSHTTPVPTSQFLATASSGPSGTNDLAVIAGCIIELMLQDPFFAGATVTQATINVTVNS